MWQTLEHGNPVWKDIGNEYKSKGGMYPLYMHTALFLIDLDNSDEHGLLKFTLYVAC